MPMKIQYGLDNFMDDMTNMLQETNDKEYNLFNDVG